MHSAMQCHADATPQRPVRFCGAHLSVSACRSACRPSTAASSEGPSVGGARSTAAIVDSAAPKRANASGRWQYWLLGEWSKTRGRVRHAHRYARAASANIGGSSARGGGVTNTPVKVQEVEGPSCEGENTRTGTYICTAAVPVGVRRRRRARTSRRAAHSQTTQPTHCPNIRHCDTRPID
jgi:hypothetical protein